MALGDGGEVDFRCGGSGEDGLENLIAEGAGGGGGGLVFEDAGFNGFVEGGVCGGDGIEAEVGFGEGGAGEFVGGAIEGTAEEGGKVGAVDFPVAEGDGIW